MPPGLNAKASTVSTTLIPVPTSKSRSSATGSSKGIGAKPARATR